MRLTKVFKELFKEAVLFNLIFSYLFDTGLVELGFFWQDILRKPALYLIEQRCSTTSSVWIYLLTETKRFPGSRHYKNQDVSFNEDILEMKKEVLDSNDIFTQEIDLVSVEQAFEHLQKNGAVIIRAYADEKAKNFFQRRMNLEYDGLYFPGHSILIFDSWNFKDANFNDTDRSKIKNKNERYYLIDSYAFHRFPEVRFLKQQELEDYIQGWIDFKETQDLQLWQELTFTDDSPDFIYSLQVVIPNRSFEATGNKMLEKAKHLVLLAFDKLSKEGTKDIYPLSQYGSVDEAKDVLEALWLRLLELEKIYQ